ncbi:MAG: pimeloyl-ACP methyl ester carboxylesterase [Granulosicoccus sp.]|jgi:pimeloyl-ACP methyl ester carboxylesterase|tara:strand:- start:93 stop:944 length:852 start_codon:yes stop_codon:yes gene_type:complete
MKVFLVLSIYKKYLRQDSYFLSMSNYITYKNCKVHFTSTGKGATIVLLHGFLENNSMWDSIAPELSKKNRVITIDLLGHGKTGCLGYLHTMEEQANTVKEVLRSLNLRKYILVGHSMGGYISLAFAQLFPEAIKGLCLINSTFENDSEERKKLRARAVRMAHTDYENLVRMSFTNLFAEESRLNYTSEIKKGLTEAFKTPLQGYIASQEGMTLRKDFSDLFKNARFKKLLILGKKDTVVDYESTIKFAKKNNIPTIGLSEGHMSHIENSVDLLDALKKFIPKF